MPGKIVSREDWITARKDLLVKEKAALRASDAFNAQLRDFPMVKLDKPYVFEGPEGKVNMLDLFQGRKQLIIYHFMLEPTAEAGCPGCSFLADNVPHLSHLNSRDTTFIVVSRAPFVNIEKVKKRMDWTFPWYSSFGSDFNYDFHVSQDESIRPSQYNYEDKETLEKKLSYKLEGEQPGLSVFFREANELFHTYSTYARGLEGLLGTYWLLDLTPLGRQDHGMAWKLHDEYDDKEERETSN